MCPVCNQPMFAFELDGVEIDHCPQCEGTWLDAGELEQLSRMAGMDDGPVTIALERVVDGPRSKRRCPRCTNRLREIELGGDERITLDRCRRGHGLWFDRGELMLLVREHLNDSDDEGTVARYFGRLFNYSLRESTSQDAGSKP